MPILLPVDASVPMTARHTVVEMAIRGRGSPAEDVCGGLRPAATAARLVSQNSGERLDVASGSTADGATVIQYTCGSGTDQQWTRTES